MSDRSGRRTIIGDGFRVEYELKSDAQPVFLFFFLVASDLDDRSTATITVELPDAIDSNAVGFHPEYGLEHWSIEDSTLVFEHIFDPGEEYTTLVAVRDPSHDPAQLLSDISVSITATPETAADTSSTTDGTTGEPEPKTTSPATSTEENRIADIANQSESQAVKALLSGKRDTVLGSSASSDASAGDDQASSVKTRNDTESPTLDDGHSEVASNPPTGDPSSSGADESNPSSAQSTPPTPMSPSHTQRVDHLQQRVSDLETYTDVLDTLIDNQGTGTTILDDHTMRIETLEADVSRLSRDLESISSTVDTVEQKVELVFEEVTTLDQTTAEITADLETLETELTESIERLQSDIERLRADLADLENSRPGIESSDVNLTDIENFRSTIETAFTDEQPQIESEPSWETIAEDDSNQFWETQVDDPPDDTDST